MFLLPVRPVQRMIGDDDIRPRAEERRQKFGDDALFIQHARPCRRLDHGILPADIVDGERQLGLRPRRVYDVQIGERGLETDIEVDGGIKLNNVKTVLEAGANVIVAGSAVFSGDVEKNVTDFLEILRQ